MSFLHFRRSIAGFAVARGLHCFKDAHVARTTAEIASEPFLDLLQRRPRMLAEQVLCCHDHAGRADTALRPAVLEEAALQGVQQPILTHTLDGADVHILCLQNRYETGIGKLSVK